MPTDAPKFEEIDLEEAQGYKHRTAVELSLRLQQSLQGAGRIKSSDVSHLSQGELACGCPCHRELCQQGGCSYRYSRLMPPLQRQEC